ncbi:MAG: hypothetical protein ACTSPQ_19115, partial [Candidatus Helarchaeota archaeon]
NVSRLGFELKKVWFNVSVRGATQIVPYLNGTQTININAYFDEIINITCLFNDTEKNQPISNASL